jgi:phage portal protein BeeE
MAQQNWFQSLFSSWNNKASEKQFFTNRVQMLGSTGAIYLDTDVPYKLFNEIPELNQTINKGASMFSNGVFKLQDIATGAEVKDVELFMLLENPNVLESQNSFLKTYYCQFQTYGNQFIYKNKTSNLLKYPKTLMNISPSLITPEFTGKVFDQILIQDIIKNYKYKESNIEKTFQTNDIIWSKNTDLDNPLIGVSPLKSLRFPLSNTKLAYDYLNIISGDKGAIGILSMQSKDSAGAIPMTASEKTKIENSYRSDFGTGIDNDKMRIHITNGQVLWQPMTYPTKDLLLMEQIDANKLTIVDHFGLNINLFSSKSQTFENVRNAIIQTYQDTIIPFADSFTQKLSKELGVPKTQRLFLDYSHLDILNDKFENMGQIVTAINQAVQGGLLSGEQAEQILASQIGIDVPMEKSKSLLNNVNRLSPLVANKVLESMTINQKLDLVGLPPIEGGDTLTPQTNTFQ